MSAGMDQVESASLGDLEQRTRELLLDSAQSLPGHVRSRLTQARHAAADARQAPLRHRLHRWMPAGAMAAAVLAVLVLVVPHHSAPLGGAPMLSSSIEDIDLLTSDMPLTADQDVDYEFYEWAVDTASAAPEGPPPAAQSAAHGT